MQETTKPVFLLTSAELDNLVQTSVRKAMGEHSFKIPDSDSKPMNVNEASEFTGIPVDTLYGYTHSRNIPFYKPGRSLMFFKSELIEWMKEGKKKTRKEIENER
jgi:excisionase family DNA binding protein